jgi:hypothetical protein
LVHFVIETGGEVRPLCGDWGDDPSWTKIPDAATCPACRARVDEELHPPSTDPTLPRGPAIRR